MNIELHIDPPKFQVGDWVLLSHPLYKKNTVGMITKTRCLIRAVTVISPPEFSVQKHDYVYWLHNQPGPFTFFAEADLEYITADLAEEIENENKGL